MRNLVPIAETGSFGIQRGTNHELRAGKDCNAGGLRIQHGSRADGHFSGAVFLYQSFDHPGCARHGESHFQGNDTTSGARLGNAHRVLGDIRTNNGDEPRVDDSVKHNELLNRHGWELSLVRPGRLNYFTRHAGNTS